MYDELMSAIRNNADHYMTVPGEDGLVHLLTDAADAIEELSRQRDRAYARLCEWCGVCPVDRRNLEDCEIAAIYPEPPKEEA